MEEKRQGRRGWEPPRREVPRPAWLDGTKLGTPPSLASVSWVASRRLRAWSWAGSREDMKDSGSVMFSSLPHYRDPGLSGWQTLGAPRCLRGGKSLQESKGAPLSPRLPQLLVLL